jgi:hypothetical protein
MSEDERKKELREDNIIAIAYIIICIVICFLIPDRTMNSGMGYLIIGAMIGFGGWAGSRQ